MKEKRDFGQVIKDFDGRPLTRQEAFGLTVEMLLNAIVKAGLTAEATRKLNEAIEEQTKGPLTLSEVALAALRAGFEDERNLPAGDREKRFWLGMRCFKRGMVKIAIPEERDLIKQCIGKMFNHNVIVPVAHLMLEGKTIELPPDDDDEDPPAPDPVRPAARRRK